MQFPTFRRVAPFLVGIVLAFASASASAHHKAGHTNGPAGNHGGGSSAGDVSATISPTGATLRFDGTTIRLVADWFDANPGLRAQYSALPPGIARNLARGKPLPPGIAKRFLPDGLTALLPPAPSGYGRFIIGDDLMLIELDSGLISDVADLFR